MNITLDNDQVRTLVQEGIIAQLTGEQREAIISQALAALLTKPRDNYGRESVSPLQSAFNTAVQRVSERLATELIEENPEVRSRIKEQLIGGVELALKDYRVKSAITDTITKALDDTY